MKLCISFIYVLRITPSSCESGHFLDSESEYLRYIEGGVRSACGSMDPLSLSFFASQPAVAHPCLKPAGTSTERLDSNGSGRRARVEKTSPAFFSTANAQSNQPRDSPLPVLTREYLTYLPTYIPTVTICMQKTVVSKILQFNCFVLDSHCSFSHSACSVLD